jgi:hypothetical protein
VTLAILAGLIQIIAVLAIVGTATLATSLRWALCERLVGLSSPSETMGKISPGGSHENLA